MGNKVSRTKLLPIDKLYYIHSLRENLVKEWFKSKISSKTEFDKHLVHQRYLDIDRQLSRNDKDLTKIDLIAILVKLNPNNNYLNAYKDLSIKDLNFLIRHSLYNKDNFKDLQ